MVLILNSAFSTWFGKIITYPKIWFIGFHKSQSAFYKVVLKIIVILQSISCGYLASKSRGRYFTGSIFQTCIMQSNFFHGSLHGLKTLIFPLFNSVCIILFIICTPYFISTTVTDHFLHCWSLWSYASHGESTLLLATRAGMGNIWLLGSRRPEK